MAQTIIASVLGGLTFAGFFVGIVSMLRPGYVFDAIDTKTKAIGVLVGSLLTAFALGTFVS